MIVMLAISTFIAANPGLAAWLIGGLFSIIGLLVGVYYKLLYVRLGQLEEADKQLTGRVAEVEERVGRYEDHVGAGERALNALAARIEKHMYEEENMVWTGVKSLTEKLSEIQVENVEAHATIVKEYGERMSANTERLAKIEGEMLHIKRALPNGELQEMLGLLKQLVKVGG